MKQSILLCEVNAQTQSDCYYRLDVLHSVILADDEDLLVHGVSAKFSKLAPKYQSKEAVQKLNPNNIFTTKGIVEKGKEVEVELNITDLLILQPGTIWLNGEYQSEPFQAKQYLEIDVPAFSESLAVTPSDVFQGMVLTDEQSKTKFVKLPNVKVKGKKTSVCIPMLELARFYYAGSAHLITETFNGGLDDFANLLNMKQTKFDYDKKQADIWLIRNCHDDDAPIITRLKMNKNALFSAKLLHSSIVKQKHTQQEIYFSPECYFPFIGSTKLGVLGKEMKSGSEAVFFVQTLLSCDHAMPYNRINITSADSYNPRPLTEEEREIKDNLRKKQKQKDAASIENNNRPDGELERSDVVFEAPERFMALKKVKIKKVRDLDPDEDKQGSSSVVTTVEGHKTNSTLKGKSSGETNPVNLTYDTFDMDHIKMTEALEEVAEIVFDYARKKGLKVFALPRHNLIPSVPYGVYKFIATTSHKRIKWHKVDTRNRLALFLRIEGKAGTIYLLEIESKGNQKYATFIFKSETGLQNYMAASLLRKIAKACGKKLKEDIFSKLFYEVIRVVHSLHHKESIIKHLEKLNDK